MGASDQRKLSKTPTFIHGMSHSIPFMSSFPSLPTHGQGHSPGQLEPKLQPLVMTQQQGGARVTLLEDWAQGWAQGLDQIDESLFQGLHQGWAQGWVQP